VLCLFYSKQNGAAEQTDVAYQEVKEIKSVGRGVGLWGDMVVVLNDDSKVELRSLDRCGVLGCNLLMKFGHGTFLWW
jgi:hypothetical protein